MVLQRRLTSNGKSIATLPNRELAAGKKLMIRYDITLGEERASVTVELRDEGGPHSCRCVDACSCTMPTTCSATPSTGRHRRHDTAFGINENMTRYAYDFTIADEQGRMHRDDGEENGEWFGFGQPAAGDRPDGTKSKRAPLDYARNRDAAARSAREARRDDLRGRLLAEWENQKNGSSRYKLGPCSDRVSMNPPGYSSGRKCFGPKRCRSTTRLSALQAAKDQFAKNHRVPPRGEAGGRSVSGVLRSTCTSRLV
jgi:hypothetical protein